MATYTTNYGLHQWEASDDFLRTDFNTDFAKIDAALGEKADGEDLAEVENLAEGKCRVVTGSYTGSGTSERTITLGFRPKVVAVDNMGSFSSGYELGIDGIDRSAIRVVNSGFQASGGSIDMNESGELYRYYAFV